MKRTPVVGALMLTAALCAGRADTARAQNGPDQTARTLTDVGKGLGSCAAQKPDGCLSFAIQLLTGSIGAESDNNKMLDKLDSVTARLDGLKDQMTNLNNTMLTSFRQIGLDVNVLGIDDSNTDIYHQIDAIKTYYLDFGYAANACKNFDKLSAADKQTCTGDTTAVAADLKTVFDQRNTLNDQLMGFGSPNKGLLYRIWVDAAGNGNYQGPDLAAAVQHAYDYYAHVQAMQLVLVAQYVNRRVGANPNTLVASSDVWTEIKEVQSNLNQQRAMIPPVPFPHSFMDNTFPTKRTRWELLPRAYYPRVDGIVVQYSGARVATMADIKALLASWNPASGSAAQYVAKLILGSGASSSDIAEMAASMDTVWTSDRPDIGNREDNDYQIGCETTNRDNNDDRCIQALIHKENYQKVVATLVSARDLNTRFSSISWANTFSCKPPHFTPNNPFLWRWVNNGKPCSWWVLKADGPPSVDPNFGVYVLPHGYSWFMISPTLTGDGVLPPAGSQ